MTIVDLFDAAVADRGMALAYDDVTHAALHLGAARVATQLHERGLRAGDRLSIFIENRIAFAYAYLAALRSGIIVVPTNVLYRSSDLQHVVDHAAVAAIVTSKSTREHVAKLETAPTSIDADLIESWALDASIVVFDGPRPQPDAVATILYTSGTTGRAKGAMMTHANLAAIVAQLSTAWRWRRDDVLLIALPLFHTHGLVAAMTTSLAVGSRIVVHERFDAHAIVERLLQGDVTMFFGVPTMYVRLLEQPADLAIPKLRLFVSGSAALSAETHSAFEARFGAKILERYGATEFGFALTNRYGGPRVPGAVGIPTPGCSARIVPVDSTIEVAPGDVGELLIAGPNVFVGYWNDPDSTEAAFTTDPAGTRWYRSGDLATYDVAEDVYRIVGRCKELIISGGFNIYPREVEDELERFEGVRAAAVVGVVDTARGELPIAFIEVDRAIDVEKLLAHLRERLASFKVPKAIRVIETLPRNALGKIEKAKLREMLGAA